MAKFIVDDNNNGDFNTIAEAVAAAKDGDEIIVTGGDDNIQNEANIVIDKKLKIESDQDGATIDGGGAGRIFTIDDGDENKLVDVEIKELTLTGGNSADLGGAILNSEKLKIQESTITGNTAELRGGGIYNLNGELKIEKSTISNNTANQRSGGGIGSITSGKVEIKETVIENNSASAGGGVAVAGGTPDTGIMGEVKIEKSTISGHTSFVGAGVFANYTKVEIKDSNITDNTAFIAGGGILNNESILKVEKTNVTGNSVAGGNGGGILNASVAGSTTIKDSNISSNSASVDGGGIASAANGTDGAGASNATLTVENTTFDGNSAGDDGGAIFAYSTNFELKTSTITNNDAAFGAVTSEMSDTTIKDNDFYDNSGFFGGAIVSVEDDNLLLDKNDFNNNTSTVGNSDVQIFAGGTRGTENSESLMGTSGDDVLEGLAGNDTIEGLGGNDIITGGEGNDVFALAAGQGTDTIADFIDGEDLVSISGGVSFNDLNLSGSEIGLDGETLAVLTGVDTSTLTSDDFLL